jgi:hypothetical protein
LYESRTHLLTIAYSHKFLKNLGIKDIGIRSAALAGWLLWFSAPLPFARTRGRFVVFDGEGDQGSPVRILPIRNLSGGVSSLWSVVCVLLSSVVLFCSLSGLFGVSTMLFSS